jgi:hypothetical protein
MSESESPAWLDGGDHSLKDPWRPIVLMLPRFALVMTREGVKRQLLWPGTYETRSSRTLNATIFRARR